MWPLFLCLLCSCSSVFYQPDRKLHVAPQNFDIFPTNLVIQSDEKTKISGWFFKSSVKKTKGTIVQFHGNAQNMSSHYMTMIWVLKHGYHLMVFDYRGYGRSQGEPSQAGLYRDGLAALEQAHELHQKHSPAGKFVVLGQSLGGAVLARSLADFENKKEVDVLILDSTFASYKDVSRRTLQMGWLTYIFSPLTYILISDEYASGPHLPNLKMKTLVIHDEFDPVVSIKSGEKVFELLGSKNKTFWKLKWRSHIAAFAPPMSPYRVKLINYLNEK